MLSVADLVSLGFSSEQAVGLRKDHFFILKFKSKSKQEFDGVLKKIMRVYGVSRERAVKAVFSHPQFAGLDHSERVQIIQRVYGVSRKKAVRAVFSFPRFADYDHSRVLRETVRLGRIVGLSRQEVIDMIFEKPVLASYSQRRNLAAIDAFRNALSRAGKTVPRETLFEWYKKSFGQSPYPVKKSKKRESWWLRRKPDTPQSKMGKKIERRVRKLK